MKKENMNDKGFSLVELIIVIAIMAILLVVLAPQYLKYVERSRNSTDLQNATEMVNALQIFAADPDASESPTNGKINITDSADGNLNSNAFAKAALKDAGLLDASDNLKTRCQSKTAWKAYEIKWSVGTGTQSGQLIFEYSATGGNDTGSFATKMAGGSGATKPATPATPATP